VPELEIRPGTEDDVPLILSLIRELAEYERLSHEVVATEEMLRDSLFGERRAAEVLLGHLDDEPAGFALFFHNFSTFLGRPGIYLEDLYVRPEFRGAGVGRAMLVRLARLARERGCGRLEWSVLDWNEPAISFYKRLGASPVSGWSVYRVTGEALEELAAEG
jgi:GNAT superfamily N-acetyltransferase